MILEDIEEGKDRVIIVQNKEDGNVKSKTLKQTADLGWVENIERTE